MRKTSFALVIAALAALVGLAGCPKDQKPAEIVDAGAAGAGGDVGAALGAGISGSAHQAPGESAISKLQPNDVVLKVDGVAFTRLRLDQAIIQAGMQAGIPPMMLDGASKVAFEKPAYEKLIERQLLIGEVKRRGLQPTLEQAENETKGDRERLLSQLPPGKTFADMLKEMGTDEAGFKAELPNDVGIKRLLDQIEKTVPPPAEDTLKKFYEDNKARMMMPETASVSHILVTLAEGAPEADVKAALAKAKAIAAEAKGKDKEGFAKLAEQKSEDPMAKKTRGDLGMFARGDLLPEIEKVAFALKQGEVSEPVQSKMGFHVLFGQGTTQARLRTFDEVKGAIAQRERQRMLMETMDGLLEELRGKAKIERVVEPAKSPFDDKGGGAPAPGGAPTGAAPPAPGAPAPGGAPPAPAPH